MKTIFIRTGLKAVLGQYEFTVRNTMDHLAGNGDPMHGVRIPSSCAWEQQE